MKRILLIASTPLSNDGLTKIEMDVIDYNKGIIDFEVACGFGFENEYGKKLKEQGIKCHSLPPKKHIVSYMTAIRKLIKSKGYDAVYIHGNSAMMFMEAIPAKMAGTRVITHCHNTNSDFPLVHHIMKPLFNVVVDRKIGCSEMSSKWAYCGNNVITIPNGVDIERFKYDEGKRKEIRQQLNWEDKKIIGHIGRFNKQKNHWKLISIFDAMHHMDEEVRLLLIGDGELKEEIIAEIDRRNLTPLVKIIDRTDRPQDYLQAMDVMVMPSLYEGLCLVALEAQANGLPVLLDEHFSPETFSTTQAKEIALGLSDEEWARATLESLKSGRDEVSEQLKESKMDCYSMLDQIQQVLLF